MWQKHAERVRECVVEGLVRLGLVGGLISVTVSKEQQGSPVTH